MKRSKKTALFLILTILWMLFIFFQSALSASLSSLESDGLSDRIAQLFQMDPEQASFLVRKCAHFLEYLILGGLLSLSLKELLHKRMRPFFYFLIAFGIGAVYAVTDEFHQTFVSGRSGEVRDVLIDCCGVLLGVLIIGIRARFVQRRSAHT